MSDIFENLGFNFDTNRFGDAQYLSEGAQNMLKYAPLTISPWMVSDMSNGAIQMTNYYKNPTENLCSSIYTTSNNIVTFSDANNNTFIASDEIKILRDDLANLMIYITEFKSHTDNVSGVHTMTSNMDTIPSLMGATSYGNQALRILNTTDSIQNSTPILGCMTSLFINDELTANNNTLNTMYVTMQNNTVANTCTLSGATISTYIVQAQSISQLVNTRRTDDWSFYTNIVNLVSDHGKLSHFQALGNTETYLINNLIGTDHLINSLKNM